MTKLLEAARDSAAVSRVVEILRAQGRHTLANAVVQLNYGADANRELLDAMERSPGDSLNDLRTTEIAEVARG